MSARLTLLASVLALSACATPPSAPPAATAPSGIVEQPEVIGNQQLDFKLASGTYHCEMGQRVDVQRPSNNANQILISWTGRRYQLARNPSRSGLPRFEDERNGLVWIDLPWKSILLDRDSNKPLASDCKLG